MKYLSVNFRVIAIIISGLIIIAVADVSLALGLAFVLKIAMRSDHFIVDFSRGYLTDDSLLGYGLLFATLLFLICSRLFVMHKAAQVTYENIYKIYVSVSSTLLRKYFSNFDSALQASSPGLITKKLQSDVNLIIGGLLIPASNIMVELLVIVAILIYVIREAGLIIVFFIAAPLVILVLVVALWFKRETLRLGNIRNIEEERKSALLVNFEKSAIDVVVFKAQSFALNLFSGINNRLSCAASKQNTDLLLSRISFESIFAMGMLALIILPLLFGADSLNGQKLNGESTVALISVMAIRLLPGLSRVIQLFQTMAYVWPTARIWLENSGVSRETPIFLYFDNRSKLDNAKSAEDWILQWPVFTIYRGQELLMRGSIFNLRRGEFISVFGKSGSGKTSLLTAIFLHLEGLQHGMHKVAWIRQNIGFISQDSIENVTLSPRESTDRNKLSKALQMAGFEDSFLERLENGSSRSDQFSGGQIQRLNLARAFYHGANVLLLDEFTSALDPSTEMQIYHSLSELKQHGLSVIFVSHRESVKQFSDRIYSIGDQNLMAFQPI